MLYVPSLDFVLSVHDRLIDEYGGRKGVSKLGLVESALNRPVQIATYSEKELDIFDLAAALCWGMAKNHGFVDGNKRTAFMVSMIFLTYNHEVRHQLGNQLKHLNVQYSDDIVRMMECIVRGEISEQQLAALWREKMKLALKKQ